MQSNIFFLHKLMNIIVSKMLTVKCFHTMRFELFSLCEDCLRKSSLIVITIYILLVIYSILIDRGGKIDKAIYAGLSIEISARGALKSKFGLVTVDLI